MRRLLLLLTVLLLLPGLEQTSAPASESAFAASGKQPVLATSGSGPTSRLFFADPVSLRPVGPRPLRLGFNWGDFARSPDGSLLALSRNDAPKLRFVRLGGLRFAGTMTFPNGQFVRLIAWPAPHMLFALLDPAPQRVLAIDPSRRKVLWERSIGGSVLDVARSRDGLVVLAAPAKGIGAATIATIGVDGSLRSVVLDRVSAGFRRDESLPDVASEVRSPGLAVDPRGNRAYVVGAGEPIARVDLASMRVTYHGGSRTLAKAVTGPERRAIWLGNGILAVAGSESSVRIEPQRLHHTVTPTGLILVDTRTWATRMLQANATAAIVIGRSLLAYGSSYDSATDTRRGFGVTVYGFEGTRRLHLFGRTPIDSVGAQGGLAYVWLPDRNGHVVVVDPKSRRILASVTRPSIALLTRR